ncbi:hypothetical protein EXS65_02820 [Candidatus Peribacteria bacterium]|nr:hypothetical protein [Candidatus Peribacteria bacterium]
MRVSRLFLTLFFAAIFLPSSAAALEGIGPRVTVTGTVQEVRQTQKQKFDQIGGVLIIKATNGQIVTVVLHDTAKIISEGKLSRKTLITANIQPNMLVRVTGWRVDSKTLTASLVIIQNIELNPALSLGGVLQEINGNKISVLTDDGKTRVLTLTNETVVNISYELTGVSALSLLQKQVLLTLNPNDQSLVRILRVTGNKGIIQRK